MSDDQNTPSGAWASQWFSGKCVLVTGGTSGIGAAIVRGFLEAGARVIGTGVSNAEVEAASRQSELRNGVFQTFDVRRLDDVTELLGSLDRLDCLVNCAGVIRRGDEHDPAVFEAVVDVNLNGTMRVCAGARSLLTETSGTIVNLASMLSFFGGGLVPGYSASKGGIAQLTKSLAIAYAKDGIRVNAVAPGWIETPLTTALRSDQERSSAILGRTPLGRWGRPQDVTGAVLFLCSPAAAFITGAVVPVDGGYAVA
ncbi:MAG TPA: SDR family oxidoreductase [Microvirga sp.]